MHDIPAFRPIRRSVVAGVLLLGTLAVAACGDDTPAPEPGEVRVRLVSPSGAEGGAVFEIRGETVTDAGSDASTLFVRQVAGRSRVVLVREPAGALDFRMDVENVHQPPEVAILEVAGPDDALRGALTGYRVEVEVVR